jgi:5-hydroxyisourate hydrolase-like protein (transthyretin family)
MLSPAQQMTGVRFAMTPTAAISGRILDGAGQPMPGVAVQLVKPLFQDGRRMMTTMKSTLTNDLGDYRIFWVPPGSYYVNVIPPLDTPIGGGIPLVVNPYGQPAGRSLWSDQANVMTRPIGSGLRPTEAYLPIFFPGTADENSATPVELQPGADVRSIDIRVTPVRAWRVQGVVLNSATRQPAPGVPVQLFSLTTGRTLQTTSDAMGMYSISRVPSGPYVLVGILQGDGLARLINIEVRDSDIDARIELQPLLTVSGRINGPNPPAFAVRLRLDFPVQNPPQLSATPAADGSFIFRNVPPGDYRVFVAPVLLPQLPPPPTVPSPLETTYVKSIRMGTSDALNGRLRIDEQPTSTLDITLASDAGRLAGRALNARQEPAAGVTVVMLPEVERRLFRTDLYRVTSTNQNGQFLMNALPPGEYRIFAWENVEDRQWQDPAFMRRYEEMGKTVRIRESEEQSVEVSSIP